MNHTVELTFTIKFLSLRLSSDCSMKIRPSKAKIFAWKFVPFPRCIIYHDQNAKKSFLEAQKSLRFLKFLKVLFKVLSDCAVFKVISHMVFFDVLSDSVLFRFLSDMALFEFLTDRLFFRVLSVSFLPWVFSALFLVCPYFPSEKPATTFFYERQMFFYTL